MTPIICDADDHTAIVTLPTRAVVKWCSWCGMPMTCREVPEDSEEDEDEYGICDSCKLAYLEESKRLNEQRRVSA